MPQQHISESVNIMLTPQFYTLKKENLPVKYAFQAKKIAPSLFEGLLENDKTYDFMVYKEENNWVFIAYDLEEITNFLQAKGIGTEQVGKLFFAQQSHTSFSAPVLLGEKNVLRSMDGTMVVVPQSALQENTQTLTIDETFTPKKGITLQESFHSFITQKQALGLASLFIIFSLVFFVEGWRYGSASDSLKEEISILLDKYPSMQSQYTRKNIAAKYKAIDKAERKKRDIIKQLAGMIFKGVKVESFKMDEKSFNVRFSCKDAKVAKRLRELAKKEGFTSAKTMTGNIVQIEEKL